jgi:hypothetical protein
MLLGLVAQLGALLAIGLAILALLDSDAQNSLVRLFFAIWLQVFSLTMFTWQRRREGG